MVSKFLKLIGISRSLREDRSVFDLPSRACTRVEKYGPLEAQFIEVFDTPVVCLGQVVLIHGGFWRPEYDLVHLRSYAAALADEGWRVQLIEYRRTPGFPDNYCDDVRAAIVHCGGGILIGHSAGGHLALIAPNPATSPLIRAVIVLAPVGDLVEAEFRDLGAGAVSSFLGVPASHRPDLDPHVTLNTTAPIVIIHGVNDQRVPIEISRKLNTIYNQAGLGSTLIEIGRIGHFELIDFRKQPFGIVLSHLKTLSK